MRLLVGVDGSGPSLEALAWAAATARSLHAEVIVAHVYAADPSDTSSWDDAHVATLRRLEGWCAPAREAGIAAEPTLLDGEIGPALLGAAGDHSADLVVVGRCGSGGVVHSIIGSVCDYVAHHARLPVAILPPGTASESPKHLLICVDGSEGSLAAVAWASQVTAALGARLTAVYVPPLPELLSNLSASQRAIADDALAGWTAVLDGSGLDVDRRIVEQENPADAIIEIGTEAGADTVVIGTRAIGGLRRIRLGGVTMQLFHHSPLPVIAVPPHT